MSQFLRKVKGCCSSVGCLWVTLAVLVGVSFFVVPMMVERQVQKVVNENPTLLVDSIKENPIAFMEAIRDAAKMAQEKDGKKREEDEKRELEERFDDPLVPVIRKDENIRGRKDAPITLVEYSDFECPFCTRAFDTVEELRKNYGDKLRFVYKHLPLNFHPNAMGAATYYEGVRVQDGQKAWRFHDELMRNLAKVKNGEGYFKSVAKKLGVNMTKLAKDVGSAAIKMRIEEDMKEAAKFGIQGTPGFIINGVPVKGAFPASHFNQIIDKLKAKGKIQI